MVTVVTHVPLKEGAEREWDRVMLERPRDREGQNLSLRTTGRRMERSQHEISSLFKRVRGRCRIVPSDHLK